MERGDRSSADEDRSSANGGGGEDTKSGFSEDHWREELTSEYKSSSAGDGDSESDLGRIGTDDGCAASWGVVCTSTRACARYPAPRRRRPSRPSRRQQDRRISGGDPHQLSIPSRRTHGSLVMGIGRTPFLQPYGQAAFGIEVSRVARFGAVGCGLCAYTRLLGLLILEVLGVRASQAGRGQSIPGKPWSEHPGQAVVTKRSGAVR
ncbi:hypothetical protein BJ138DRAFT_807860 [Hygrophoropsis aurantiaca]|uniref:Uncharacterized protein n=1 Tax=Hygrophoropsis aurantiaca TaxID=72124 RepID=A0ACB7ZWM8_9AGAM|nr:hypothetical protein BJ138DRAFT_807860 [Hygrophoropsis aurantiaca]